MYAHVTIHAVFDRAALRAGLRKLIGTNLISPAVALSLADQGAYSLSIRNSIVAAERTLTTTAVYCYEGSDTISIYLFSSRCSELRHHVERISRQLKPMLVHGRVSSARAKIVMQENQSEEPIIIGEARSLSQRFLEALAGKWLSRIATPAIVFLGALQLLPGTPAVSGGLLAFAAATISFVAEAFLVMCVAEDWKWTQCK